MTTPDLHTRLEAIGRKIDETRERLEAEKRLFHDKNDLTAADLKKRYKALEERLGKDMANADAQGRRVSDLEKSVWAWLNEIDSDN